MPSKFGGIPVDEKPTTGSKFGGVAVQEPIETPVAAAPTSFKAPDLLPPGYFDEAKIAKTPQGAIQKGLALGGEEIGIAGKQLMSGFKSTPEQEKRLKEIEQEASKLPFYGRAMRYAPEVAAAVPAAFAVPEIATAGGLATALGLGGLSSTITQPVKKASEGGKFLKEKGKQFVTGAEESGLGLGLGTAVQAIPGVLKTIGKYTIGTSQPEIDALARAAEKEGFVLEPGQLRKDKPVGTPGFMEAAKAKNEKIATKLSSKTTGKETENITPEFLSGRKKELSKEYDTIFGRNLTIDSKLVGELQKMKDFEMAVSPAGVTPVRSTANNIIDRWNTELANAQQKTIDNNLKRILQQQGRGGVEPIVRLRKDWPTIRDASSPNVPEWASSVEKTITELSDSLGLKTTPKMWVSSPRREGLYGMATGDGHIVINDTLDAKGALATALHEFGHQAEFQLFAYAPKETRTEVIKAFNQQMQSIPVGVKTIEQHRPITSEKYGESRKQIPDKGFETGYLRDFSEWFAEQTSRWITTSKTPTTVVEKFFKDVADSWKKIYQKVSGYVPMVDEVDKFFRSNWKGDLMQSVTQDASAIAKSIEPVAVMGKDLTAAIDGRELQRLRENMTRIARTATDGRDREVAGNFVSAIDDAIGRQDRALLDRLRQTNRQYAATATLADGIEKGFVSGGKVSLEGLGKYLSNRVYGYGSGTSQHPLYELGYMGKALGLRSRAEGINIPEDKLISALAGRSKQLLGGIAGARSQTARNIQRQLTEEEIRNAGKP